MTTVTADLYAVLARYAARFHAAAGDRHHVASPLGAWLLLALAGTADSGHGGGRAGGHGALVDALGLDVPAAARAAADLLADPHPAVLAAAAVWRRPAGEVALADWLAGLPPQVRAGDVPDQAGADAWTRQHTAGLIERFPLRIQPTTLLVLATALATRVSWKQPFDTAAADDLRPHGAWRGRVGAALRTPAAADDEPGIGHEQFVATTARAGDVAVHRAHAREGLTVTSVAAAPGVPAADVLAAAYDLAGPAPQRRRSLFDLPLGDGPAWTLTERRAWTAAPDGRQERCVAVLPAWAATSDHDLDRPELGVPAAAAALVDALRRAGIVETDYEARQAATARYTRVGFEAAAVSAMAVRVGMAMMGREGLVREAVLRFGHPYAVVATATTGGDPAGGSPGGAAWHGLPVFSAWVAEPTDAG